MRVLLVKQASDLQTLSARLVGRRSAGASTTLERVKSLNPHVDFNRIEAGTVLLLPDSPDLEADDADSRSIVDDAFEEVVREIQGGFKAALERISRAGNDLSAGRTAVNAVLKTAALKRLIEGDPLLKRQLSEAGEASGAEMKSIQDAAKQVKAMQKASDAELALLRKLLA